VPDDDGDDDGDDASGSGEEECRDDVEGAEATKKNRKKKHLAQGSNSQAHRMMRSVMSLWLGNEMGPEMGDGPARNVRNKLTAEGIVRYQVLGLVSMAPAIAEGTNSEFDQRIRQIAQAMDKVEIALLSVLSDDAHHVL
jgi:hypothetical protein